MESRFITTEEFIDFCSDFDSDKPEAEDSLVCSLFAPEVRYRKGFAGALSLMKEFVSKGKVVLPNKEGVLIELYKKEEKPC